MRYSAALLAITTLVPAQDPGASRVRFTDLLSAMTDMDWLITPPPKGERNVQFSSYDRRSDKGPGSHPDWYANRDAGNFLRVEERAGRKERVLVDAKGPGSIVRIWSANPKGTLRFYVDGAKEPTWTIGFRDLCGGKKAPMLDPISGVRARGWNCYLPVPFAKAMKLTADDGGFYYHVGVRYFPAGTNVESFTPGLLTEHESAIGRVVTQLSRSFTQRTWPETWQKAGKHGHRMKSGEQHTLLQLDESAIVRQIVLQIAPVQGTRKDELLRTLRLVVRDDREVFVDVPVADFFGSAPGFRAYESWVMGVAKNGAAYCNFPMPLPRGGRVHLVADAVGGRAALECTVHSILRYETRAVPAETLRFHASWHQARGIPTRPQRDHLVLNAVGRGRYVGTTLAIANPAKSWWGEGDEKFFVDGEKFPSTVGTGTEDYFGYAWCSPQLFQSAFHAQPQCDGPNNFGHTCVNRWQIPDMVPFQKSFRFDLEVWCSGRTRRVDYATTAYWYGAAGAKSNLPPMPKAATRLPVALELPKPHVVAGVLEAESLERSLSAGKWRKQDMTIFADRWSMDTQLWWTGGGPGDRLRLTIPVADGGRYRFKVRFTKAVDYAIIQLRLDGKKLGTPIDLYDPEVVATAELDLGEVDLAAGKSTLEIAITGKNPKALAKYMVGIDYVRLAK